MEGLIPFVYRAIVQYKSGKQQGPLLGSWFNESPSASYYMRLPGGDSGRFQSSDYGFLTNSPSSSSTAPDSSTTTTTQIIVSTGVQSPVYRLASRRVAT